MERAKYGPDGHMVTVSEFIRLATPSYKERNILPYCPACRSSLEVYGAHSLNVTPHFNHPKINEYVDSLDICILSSRCDQRFAHMKPRSWDEVRGNDIRERFFRDDNLKAAYAFCWTMCGRGALPMSTWAEIIRRADKRSIWSYSGIELWSIPFILLTLCNFMRQTQSGIYGFHFFIQRDGMDYIQNIWESPGESRIVKVFSDSGKVISNPEGGPPNPTPVSDRGMRVDLNNFTWIDDKLLRKLRV